MSTRVGLTIFFCVIVLTGIGGCASSKAPPVDSKETALKREVALQAKTVMSAMDMRMRDKEPLTPTFVDLYCQSSLRLCQADAACAPDSGGKRAALDAHIKRLTVLRENLIWVSGINYPQRSQIDYFIAAAKTIEPARLP